MTLRLADLLDQPELGLELVAGSPDRAASRVVAGAHPIEIARPSRWVPRDWIILTTGLRVYASARDQRELVAELDENGLAALGWGVGLVVEEIPPPIIDEANARGFPVFRIPIEVPFREIVSFVRDAGLDSELYVMRRTMAMQKYLMDALHLDDPESALVDRLATLLDAEVVLFGSDGTAVCKSGRVAPEDLLHLLDTDAGTNPLQGAVHGRLALGRALTIEGVRAGWLVVVLRGRSVERLARPILQAAAQLLELISHVRDLGATDERDRRAELLLASLDDLDTTQAAALDHRAHSLGVDFSAPPRVVVWRPGGGGVSTDELRLVIQGLESALAARRIGFLLAPLDEQVVGVVQARDETLMPVLEELAEQLGLQVGAGRPIATLGEARRSLTDARIALAHGSAQGRRTMRFDELDPASWMLATCDEETVQQKIGDLLDPIREHPALLETLSVYFDTDLNVAEAARRLNVHRNTLRYRLARIESLLGVRLDSAHTIANLHLALLRQRLGQQDGGDRRRDGRPSAPAPIARAATREA